MPANNARWRREQRREEARARAQERGQRSDNDQIKVLLERVGTHGARKEQTRIALRGLKPAKVVDAPAKVETSAATPPKRNRNRNRRNKS